MVNFLQIISLISLTVYATPCDGYGPHTILLVLIAPLIQVDTLLHPDGQLKHHPALQQAYVELDQDWDENLNLVGTRGYPLHEQHVVHLDQAEEHHQNVEPQQ